MQNGPMDAGRDKDRKGAGNDTALPHDRDERRRDGDENDPQRQGNRNTTRQAHDDVESGIQDTERIGTPNAVPGADQNDGR